MNKTVNLDLSNVPKELMLMLELINEQETTLKASDGIDWDLFLQLALHHRLFPLLAVKLTKMKSNWVPKEVSQTLENYYRNNTFQMLHLCGVMEKVGRLFSENGIRSLFLKGPILAEELYGDISLRTCGDLDILIPLDELKEAENTLLELGYVKDEYIQTLLNDWKWRHHHFTYYHKNDGTKIELHWRLNPSPSTEPTFDELWERRKKTTLISHPIYSMGQEDVFFFLVTHGARHAWSRLRWLLDIHQMAQGDLNWNQMIKHLKKYESGAIGGQSLTLSAHIFHTQLPKEVQSFAFGKGGVRLAQKTVFYLERMVSLHKNPVPDDIAKYHRKYLFTLMSARQKTIYLLSALHPFYTDVETLPLPKKLHFLYFPLRPFLWVWRKTRKHALP